MNYIYDILINFNENLYDFYDWNLNDQIDHIRKIPVFKIDSEFLYNLKKNDIILNKDFLNKIYNKTEIFTMKSIKTLNYACLFCDGMEVVGIYILNGKILKSKLLIDEEEEVVEFSERLKEENITYEIIKENDIIKYKTRKEIEIETYVKKEIRNLKKENNINKLSYLYYECFNAKETNKDKMIENFDYYLEKDFDFLMNKLYKFFKLLQFNK